jgi:hypothetical protein
MRAASTDLRERSVRVVADGQPLRQAARRVSRRAIVARIDTAHFDEPFARVEERTALRHSLIGLLLPREHHQTVVELAAIVPGANRQSLHQAHA